MRKIYSIIILIGLISLNFLMVLNVNFTQHASNKQIPDVECEINQATKILIIYGDHDAGSGGQRHGEFQTYLEGMGYEVNTTHITTFVGDPSIADLFNLLIIDRSMTTNHDIVNATGRPILALGYGGGLYFTNALGFPLVTTESFTWYDNNHKILNIHNIFTLPNFLGNPPTIIAPVFYGSSWSGDGREYHFEISQLLPGSMELLNYYWDGTERTTRTVLFAYNVSSTHQTIFWGYDSYYPGGGGYVNCITNPTGLDLLQNIVEHLKAPVFTPSDFQIKNVTQTPQIPKQYEMVTINATITSTSNVTESTLYYKINNGAYNNQSMNLIEGTILNGVWQGNIPGQPYFSNISYYVHAVNLESTSLKAGPFNYTISEADPPEYANLTQNPNSPTDTDIVKINITLEDLSGINTAQLMYDVNNTQLWNSTNMSLLQGTIFDGIWNGTIPAYSNGTSIRYYINTTDYLGNNILIPTSAPVNTYGYIIGATDSEAPPLIATEINPSTPTYQDTVLVSALINMSTEVSGLKNLTLCYTSDSQTLNYKLMNFSHIEGAELLNFSVNLPTFGYDTLILYNITSYDLAGNFYSTFTYNYTVVDLYSPTFMSVFQNPTRPDVSEDVQINITIQEPILASGVKNASIYYTVEELGLLSIESPHPVPDLYTFTWNLSVPNGIIEMLHFENISLEDGFDFLYIYNGSYGLLDSVTGDINRYSIQINDSTALLELNTDMVIQSWGFFLSRMSVRYNTETLPLSNVTGDQFDGIWSVTIPAKQNISAVQYYIETFDYANNSDISNAYSYISAEKTLPVIQNINQTPSGTALKPTVSPVIVATISDPNTLFYQNSAILQYSDDGNTWNNLTMTYVGVSYFPQSGQWSATIPTFPDGTVVTYRVLAQDLANNLQISANKSYICDGTAPSLKSAKHTPLVPEHDENVVIMTNLTETYPYSDGAGVDSVTVEYYYTLGYELESPHPYQDNFTQTWYVNDPSAIGFALHFATIVLSPGDYITILDENSVMVDMIFMSQTNYWTPIVYSSNVSINLIADLAGNAWGFNLDYIEVVKNSSSQLISGTQYYGTWESIIPSFPFETQILFEVTARDLVGNTGTVYTGTYIVDDTVTPEITLHNLSTIIPTPDDDVNVTLTVVEEGSGLENVTLFLSVDGGLNWYKLLFANVSSDTWVCTIPKQPDNTVVKYYIIAYDKNGNSKRNPADDYHSLTFQQPAAGEDFTLWIVFIIAALAAVLGVLLYFISRKSVRKQELEIISKKHKKYI